MNVVLLVLTMIFGSLLLFVESNNDAVDLESLSNEELEAICLRRGFEIVQQTGESSNAALTHDDYVEAARRCLEIEQEMNEILAENPELAEELEAEVERMRTENQQLTAEKERLNQKTGGGSRETSRKNSAAKDTNAADDDGALVETASKKGEHAGKLSTKVLLRETLKELIHRVEDDVKTVVKLILPVLRPLVNAGDMVWRHLQAILATARAKAAEERKRREQNNDEENSKESDL